MRTIKFRIYDKEHKKYLEPFVAGNILQEIHSGEADEYKKHFILEQFTGLTDKNGKEIYEGDLLYAYDNKLSYEYTVIFYEGAFVYRKGKRSPKKYLNSKSIHLKKLEVIGNLYEN